MAPTDPVVQVPEGMDRHFHLGAAVRCLEGPVGTLHGLVVDRPALTVRCLIVRPQRPRSELLAVPMTYVVVPMGERLVLGVTADEVRAMPPLGEDVVQMSRASVVECEGRLLGTLDCILMDARTHRVTTLVVRKGLLIGCDLLIPVGWVRAVLGDRILLRTSWVDLAHLERFATHRMAAQRAAFNPPLDPGGLRPILTNS